MLMYQSKHIPNITTCQLFNNKMHTSTQVNSYIAVYQQLQQQFLANIIYPSKRQISCKFVRL